MSANTIDNANLKETRFFLRKLAQFRLLIFSSLTTKTMRDYAEKSFVIEAKGRVSLFDGLVYPLIGALEALYAKPNST